MGSARAAGPKPRRHDAVDTENSTRRGSAVDGFAPLQDRVMWILYQIAIAALLLLTAPILWLRRRRHYFASLPKRLAYQLPPARGNHIWIHAVSVGEVGVARTLIEALPADVPLVLTTVTPTGQEQARRQLGKRAQIAFLPFDLSPAINRFLACFSPRTLILVEGDLWPLLMRTLKSMSVPIVVVNGRISDRSYRRMRRLRWVLGPLLDPVDLFCVQSTEDKDKLINLGVDSTRIVHTGNLKFDSGQPTLRPEVLDLVRSLADKRPILIAGSTMEGEDDPVLDAFIELGGGDRGLLVLAPRHLERCDDVTQLINSKSLRTIRRSRIEAQTKARIDVLLLDSLGELAPLYELARAVFIGGTLAPKGGHNPLEAARHGVPIAIGPSMENFREIATQFDRNLAWHRVSGSRELATVWDLWLRDPAEAERTGLKGAKVVSMNQGALEATLEALQPYLPSREDFNASEADRSSQADFVS
ncbi:MAG: 3-deoxy-D-manno-octulosonic acid transferase [Thermoanaerobaculia bacterium]